MTGTADPVPVKCEICGRPLRTAQSRRTGRGRICDEKVNPGVRPGRDHSPRRTTRRATPPADGEPNLLDVLEEEQPCTPAE